MSESNQAFSTSPELTTNGMLRKAWRFDKASGIYLYKGGTEGAINTGNEPYSEYYAYQIAKKMGLKAVEYDLEQWKGILACKCKLFTDINTSFISASRLFKGDSLKSYLDYYKDNLGNEALEDLKSMLIFDAVIYNEDRHFGNFGVLRDNKSGKIISTAPIFDNGLSLFNFGMSKDFENLNEYAKTRTTPYRLSFETICSELIGLKQIRELRKLIGFKFTRHSRYNLPEARLLSIEKHIQYRLRKILEIARIKNHNKENDFDCR
ncbi:MAG: hypothetical protein R3Y33_00090 [Clostridia bacterium]